MTSPRGNWAVIVPLANESQDFQAFTDMLRKTLDFLRGGRVYLVIDQVSKDDTLQLAQALETEDNRFSVVWAPENRNVVDAYLCGLRTAYGQGHELIIEMDAGMSHDPRAIPMFLRVLNEGNECAFGSRFTNGGSMTDSHLARRFLSKAGTVLANLLLGTKMYDMTSGFQGFHREVLERLLDYPFQSKAHFYQTEVRYLLRKTRFMEVPIHYRAPSARVSSGAILNSLSTLIYYFFKRITFHSVAL